MFRAEPVGSLLRPDYLRAARQRCGAGEITGAELRRIEDQAVDEAIGVQERAGLDVVTDGEQRRLLFTGCLTDAVDGMACIPGPEVAWHGRGDAGTYDANIVTLMVVVGKLRRRKSLIRDEFAYARAKATKPIKLTLPSPLTMAFFWSPTESAAAYADPFEMFADAAAILREDILELRRLGCENIQIDAPEIGMLVDPAVRRHFNGVGIPVNRLLGEGIEIIESLARGIEGVRFAVHLCRGNNAGRWMGSGGYQSIARQVFPRLPSVHAFLLEFDSERAGSFEPLRDVPADKCVVLGLVSTKTRDLEPADALVARVDEASRFFPRDRLAVSTQCGFASVAEGNPLDADIQARKLRLVAEVAHRAFE